LVIHKFTFPALIAFLSLSFPGMVPAAERFGERYCNEPGYYCMTVRPGDSWDSLFPYEKHKDLVMRLNRMNIRLRPGMRIAVPKDIDFVSLNVIAPFAQAIDPDYTSRIVIKLDALAWGAYDKEGQLVKWGPLSGGKAYCADVESPCPTLTGDFIVYRTGTKKCKSKKFPVGEGGAKMPYCMFYDGGYAIHGSYEVPGYHASHGCVRTYIEDARWLKEEFVRKGWTRVIVR
jgi:L,D-transpeptidase ErfK/SrfK